MAANAPERSSIEAGEDQRQARREGDQELPQRHAPRWILAETTSTRSAEPDREIDFASGIGLLLTKGASLITLWGHSTGHEVRCALDWAFSPEGDAAVGVALTTAAAPLWMQLSLIEECRGRVERALSILEPAASLDARREMKLYAALVHR